MTPDKNVVTASVVEVPKHPKLWLMLETGQKDVLSSTLRYRTTYAYASAVNAKNDGNMTLIRPSLISIPAEGSAPPPEVDAVEQLMEFGQVLQWKAREPRKNMPRYGCQILRSDSTIVYGHTPAEAVANCLSALRASPGAKT